MKTKLTLSIDKDLVQFAHTQARRDKRSVSSLFSDFLVDRQAQTKAQQTASVDDIVGTLKNYSIDDTKPAIRNAYVRKHLR